MPRQDEYTQAEVIRAIQAEDAVLTRVARRLGCTPKTVRRYIDKYPKVKKARYRTNRDVRRRRAGLPPKDPDNPETPKPEEAPEKPPEPPPEPVPAEGPPAAAAPAEGVPAPPPGIRITVLPLPGEEPPKLGDLSDETIAYALQDAGGNVTVAASRLEVPSAPLRNRVEGSEWLRGLQLEIEERLLDMLIARLQAISYGQEKGVTRNAIFALTRILETRGSHRGYSPRKVAITAADRRQIVQAVTWSLAIIPEEELRHQVIARLESRLSQEAENNERWESEDERETNGGGTEAEP